MLRRQKKSKKSILIALAGLLALGTSAAAAVVGVYCMPEETPTVYTEPPLPAAGEVEHEEWALAVDQSIALTEGEQHRLQMEVLCTEEMEDSDAAACTKQVVWSSSDERVATVDQAGLITVHQPGVVEIRVEAVDGSTWAVCTVTVEETPEVVVSAHHIQVQESIALIIGEKDSGTVDLVLEPGVAETVTVEYRSSDIAVATVDETGAVQAVGNGTCVIKTTVTNRDGSTVTAETAVSVQTLTKELNVQKKLSLLVGKSKKLTVKVLPESADLGTTVTWSSSNKKVATVSKKGEVKAVSAGTATITATNAFGIVAQCTVTVTKEEPPQPTEPTCTYCEMLGHKAAQCVKKSVDKGAVGRWSIPDVNVNVAVYASTESAKENNAIVDAKDSAIYMKKGAGHLIGDHNYQGFTAIKQCKVGTVAYLDTGDGVKKYVCTRVFLGYNEKYYLADENHVEYEMATGIIANYTCNDTKGSITIVEFAPVEQARASGSAGR